MRLIAIFLFINLSYTQVEIQSVRLNNTIRFFDSLNIEIDLPFTGGYQSNYLQVLDIDGNLKKEILFTSLDIGLLHVFEQTEQFSKEFELKSNFEFDGTISRWFYFIDLNNDNILDLLSLDNFDVVGYQLNSGSNLNPTLSDFKRLKDQNSDFIIPEFGNIPVVYDFNKNGVKDLFLSTQSQGNIIHYENVSTDSVKFNWVTNTFADVSVLGRAKKHGRSSFAFIDLDYDNDTDILWGDQFQRYFYFVENITNDTNPEYQYDINDDFDGNGTIVSNFTYNLPIITKINNDDLEDIIMLPQFDPLNNIQLYIAKEESFEYDIYTYNMVPTLDNGYSSAAKYYDLNGDGLKDFIISTSSNRMNHFDLKFYLQNPLGFKQIIYNEIYPLPWEPSNLEANDFQIIDLNKDNFWDIVFVDENGVLYQSLNEGSNTNPKFTSYQTILNLLGNFAQIRILDIDHDNDFDLITTQVLGNFFLYETTNSLFDTKTELSSLSNLFDHTVTFDKTDNNHFVIIDDQNSIMVQFELSVSKQLTILDQSEFKLPYSGRNLNLTISNNDQLSSQFTVGTNNGGVLVYDINYETDEIVTSKITISPNPFKNNFTIKAPNNEKILSVKVYNLLGQLIYSNKNQFENSILISLKDISSSILFLMIQTNENIYRSKVIHVKN